MKLDKIDVKTWHEAKRPKGNYTTRIIGGIKYKFVHAPPHEPYIYAYAYGTEEEGDDA